MSMTLRDRVLIRAADILISAALIIPSVVVLAIIAVPQILVFRGRVFFSQDRVGRFGRRFTYRKLRSMREPSDREHGHGRAHLEQDRISSWGRLLRRTHLDELLELWNIFRGVESFVGPRPLIPDHEQLVSSPGRRELKPGWTGLSQMYLQRNGVLPSRIQRRLDARLADKLTFSSYLFILFVTAGALFRPRPAETSPGPTVERYRRQLSGDTKHRSRGPKRVV